MTIGELDNLAANVYRKATWHELEAAGDDTVLLFAPVGYGMSAGYVSRKWWIDKGLSILRERLQRYIVAKG